MDNVTTFTYIYLLTQFTKVELNNLLSLDDIIYVTNEITKIIMYFCDLNLSDLQFNYISYLFISIIIEWWIF